MKWNITLKGKKPYSNYSILYARKAKQKNKPHIHKNPNTHHQERKKKKKNPKRFIHFQYSVPTYLNPVFP